MTTGDKHNGWENYPTWAVNLWLSNDEGLYRQTLEVVHDALVNAADDCPSYWTGVENRRFKTADALKSFVEELAAHEYGPAEASFVVDLVGYALGQVNWHEIADGWLEDAEREIAEAATAGVPS